MCARNLRFLAIPWGKDISQLLQNLCICFAGCKDDETSADTFEGGVAVGAMSNALLEVLKANAQENQHETYAQILKKLRDILAPR